jgi:SSS family solute:Na+ symporter
MAAGLLALYVTQRVGPDGTVVREHFGGSAFALSDLGLDTAVTVYAGFVALLVNLVVTVLVTVALRAAGVDPGVDGTAETDYTAERDDPTFRELPDPLESAPPGAAGERPARR